MARVKPRNSDLKRSQPTLVVGIGASAGGVGALRKFFLILKSPMRLHLFSSNT